MNAGLNNWKMKYKRNVKSKGNSDIYIVLGELVVVVNYTFIHHNHDNTTKKDFNN